MEPFVEDLAKGAEALAQERGASLQTSLTATGRVRMDPSRIKQAVLALVGNAAKFGPEGECVMHRSTTPDGELRIDVVDRGPGIAEEDLPHIFERFYRVNGTQERGNGLGLSIAESIAEAHGGRIEAESRLGDGARMSHYVPNLAASGSGADPERV